MTPTDYCVVSDWVLVNLEKRVRQLIAQGWIPCGSVSVVNGNDPDGHVSHCFYQAMMYVPKAYAF